MNGDLPNDLRGFDFLWSMGTVGDFESTAAAADFVERAMECLRPGGIAIHMFPLVAQSALFIRASEGVAVQRGDVERMALTLIARGNDIAQLKFGWDGDCAKTNAEPAAGYNASELSAGTVPYGLVARRGLKR